MSISILSSASVTVGETSAPAGEKMRVSMFGAAANSTATGLSTIVTTSAGRASSNASRSADLAASTFGVTSPKSAMPLVTITVPTTNPQPPARSTASRPARLEATTINRFWSNTIAAKNRSSRSRMRSSAWALLLPSSARWRTRMRFAPTMAISMVFTSA